MFCFGNICCSHLSDLPSTVPPSSCGDGHHCSCWPVSLQLLSLTQYKRFRWFHITPLTRLFQNTRNLATYVYVRRIFSSSTQVAESPNCAFIIVNSGVFFLLLHWNKRLKSLKYFFFSCNITFLTFSIRHSLVGSLLLLLSFQTISPIRGRLLKVCAPFTVMELTSNCMQQHENL